MTYNKMYFLLHGIQLEQGIEKTTAVATVVAAIDQARVREPVSVTNATERSTSECVSIAQPQPVEDQVV